MVILYVVNVESRESEKLSPLCVKISPSPIPPNNKGPLIRLMYTPPPSLPPTFRQKIPSYASLTMYLIKLFEDSLSLFYVHSLSPLIIDRPEGIVIYMFLGFCFVITTRCCYSGSNPIWVSVLLSSFALRLSCPCPLLKGYISILLYNILPVLLDTPIKQKKRLGWVGAFFF